MRPSGGVLLVLGLLACLVPQAGATVLTFDDLSGSGEPIPNGYGGFAWTNMSQLDGSQPTYQESGYDHGRVSDNHVAYNAFAAVATVSDSPFDFNGAWLTGAWNDGLNIQVQGYLGAVMEYSQTVVVDTSGPTWFEFDYLNVDRLVFTSFGGVHNPNLPQGEGTHFVMDNFTFNEVIPEPATLSLLAFGALGLLARRRKR